MSERDLQAWEITSRTDSESLICLIRFIMAHPDRVLLVCSKCGAPRFPNEMVVRKDPGKGRVRFRGECKACESKRVGRAIRARAEGEMTR